MRRRPSTQGTRLHKIIAPKVYSFTFLFVIPCVCFEIIGTSDLLDDFIRRPNQWNPTLPADHLVWHEHIFDDHILNMEEECARLCVEEHGFTCRHFFVDFSRSSVSG